MKDFNFWYKYMVLKLKHIFYNLEKNYDKNKYICIHFIQSRDHNIL